MIAENTCDSNICDVFFSPKKINATENLKVFHLFTKEMVSFYKMEAKYVNSKFYRKYSSIADKTMAKVFHNLFLKDHSN